jgi:hypothetical protein
VVGIIREPIYFMPWLVMCISGRRRREQPVSGFFVEAPTPDK